MWLILVSTLYAIWYVFSIDLKAAPPNALPTWPLACFYYPTKYLLSLIGISQRAVFEAAFDPQQRYLIACCPHGAYAFSGAVFIGPQWRLGTLKEYEHHTVIHGVASALFYLPLVREIMLLVGAREIKESNILKLMKTTESSLTVIPGGLHEQINTRHDEERHYVQKRLGFCKLALELGLDIVPLYGFGENQIFTTHRFGSFFRKFVARKWRMGFPLISGRFGCTLLPLPTELVHVYGAPIKVKKTESPSQQEIEDLYALYKSEVQRIFNTYAPLFLPAEISKKGIQVLRVGIDADDRNRK